MEGAPTGFVLAFLLPFHIGGGAAIGVALHHTFKDGFSCSGLFASGFLFLWGALFGGIPLVFGLGMDSLWFFVLQLVVFVGTIVTVALGYDWLRDLYTNPGMFVATFGLSFFVVGVALATLLASDGEAAGILMGLIFGGIGGALLLLGIVLMLRN